MLRMRGIYPAMITPLTPDGEAIQFSALGPVCERLLGEGVDGLFIGGTTGSGPLLTAAEKLALLRETRQIVGSRCQVILQGACGEWPETLRVLREAPGTGADAISLLQPWYYPCDDEAQYAYFAAAAEAMTGFPLFLYNIPRMSGNDLGQETVMRLADRYGNICGMKESGSEEHLKNRLSLQQEAFQVVCGIDTLVAPVFLDGCEATVASFGNVIAPALCEIRDACQAGDHKRALVRQEFVNQVVEALDGPLLLARIMAVYRLRGIDPGHLRLPLRELNPAEQETLKESLLRLGLLE